MSELEEYFNITVDNHRLNKSLTDVLKPFGISPQEALILYILGDEVARSCSELAETLEVSLGRISMIISKLLAYKYISMNKLKENRRIHMVQLTNDGRNILYSLTS